MEFPLVQYARVIKCVYETPVLLHVHDYFIQASLERIIGWELARMRDEQLGGGSGMGVRVVMSLSGARASRDAKVGSILGLSIGESMWARSLCEAHLQGDIPGLGFTGEGQV